MLGSWLARQPGESSNLIPIQPHLVCLWSGLGLGLALRTQALWDKHKYDYLSRSLSLFHLSRAKFCFIFVERILRYLYEHC